MMVSVQVRIHQNERARTRDVCGMAIAEGGGGGDPLSLSTPIIPISEHPVLLKNSTYLGSQPPRYLRWGMGDQNALTP
jgi:hypothetical protein